jgi:hypothetical protein
MSNNPSATDRNRNSTRPTQRQAAVAKRKNRKLPRSLDRLRTTKDGVKATGMKKHKHPGGNKMLLGTHWRWQIDGMQKETVTHDAPSCLMTIRNLGPAMVEVRCPRKEPNILLKGKFTIMPVRGPITVENLEDESADICLNFEPKPRYRNS